MAKCHSHMHASGLFVTMCMYGVELLRSTLDLTIHLDIHVHDSDNALHVCVSDGYVNAHILGVLRR